MFCDVPDGNFEIDFHDVDQDPIEMAIYRGGKIGQWRSWLEDPRRKAPWDDGRRSSAGTEA